MTKADSPRTRRGPYAAGRLSKDLILTTALEVIARRGYTSTSLREIASEVGMTQAGLLYHFDSKENLLAEVLRKRDAVGIQHYGAADDDDLPLVVRLARYNIEVPGLVQLFVSLAAAAADPAHPGHEFFLDRDAVVHRRVTRDIERRQEAGTFRRDADAAVVARMMLALSDGLQSQWVIDPTIDLVGTLEALWREFQVPSSA